MTPISKLEVLPEKGLPISQWRSTDDAIYDVTLKLKDIFIGILEDNKPSKRVEKVDKRFENSTPKWIYIKFPEWLQWLLARHGLIQIHYPNGGALYHITKVREMLQKQSLDARIHYIQMKMAEAEQEIDLSSRLDCLATVWGLCEELTELSEKKYYTQSEAIRIAALFEIVKSKYKIQESVRDEIRKDESDQRTKSYYDEIDKKVKWALQKYQFEDIILRFPIDNALEWYWGYLSFLFGSGTTNLEYANVGDFLRAGDAFMVGYGIKHLSPVTGLLVSYPSNGYLEIRPIKDQVIPSDLGLFMFGQLIEYVLEIEKKRPSNFIRNLNGRWPPETVQKLLEDLKKIEVLIQPIESDKWYETR